MDKTKKKIILISLALVAACALAFFLFFPPGRNPVPGPGGETAAPSKKETVSEHYHWTKEDYQENKEINEDYIGTLRFESGLIDQPVVQGETNDTYLRTDWKSGGYALGGTCFADAGIHVRAGNGVKEDHNLVIYGHYMYPEYDPERKEMFTPLHTVRDKANYEENKYIVFLEEDEVRRYQIAAVYLCRLEYDDYYKDWVFTEDNQQYYLANFEPDYMEVYKEVINVSVNDPSLNVGNEGTGYDSEFTGVDFTSEDHILTLQTCVLNRGDLRLIVIAREINRMNLKDKWK